jgi:hypothetical protein
VIFSINGRCWSSRCGAIWCAASNSRTTVGRGLTAPQVLHALVLMRVKNWDRERRGRVADGITLRARRRRHGLHSAARRSQDAGTRAYERSPAFKRGQCFRTGIEGRISVLMRGRGMKRCHAEGAERFALFVSAAVLAIYLMIIGELFDQTLQTSPQNHPIVP